MPCVDFESELVRDKVRNHVEGVVAVSKLPSTFVASAPARWMHLMYFYYFERGQGLWRVQNTRNSNDESRRRDQRAKNGWGAEGRLKFQYNRQSNGNKDELVHDYR